MTTPYRTSSPTAPNHESDSSLVAGRYRITFVRKEGIYHLFEVVEYGRKRSWFGLVRGELLEERRYSVRGIAGAWYNLDGYLLDGRNVERHLDAAATRQEWAEDAEDGDD